MTNKSGSIIGRFFSITVLIMIMVAILLTQASANEMTPIKSGIGINTHLYNWANNLFPQYEDITKNFGIIRDGAWWDNLEEQNLVDDGWKKAKWSYPWPDHITLCKKLTYESGYDNLVKKFQDTDSPELLLLLNINNKNIAQIKEDIGPEQYDIYYDYVYHVVERYDGDGIDDMPDLKKPIRYYEIGNEPEYTIYTNGVYLTPENYTKHRLIPGYMAVKAACKECIIMNAGLGMQGDGQGGSNGGTFTTEYLEKIYDTIINYNNAKYKDKTANNFYMDKVAIHYYNKEKDLSENINKVRQVIQSKEGKFKPIWITEFGVPTGIGEQDKKVFSREEDQASLIVRNLALMLGKQIEKSIIYNLKDSNIDERFGLYKAACIESVEEISPKISFNVYNNMINILEGLRIEKPEVENKPSNPPEIGNGYLNKIVFSSLNKKVTILWFSKDDGTYLYDSNDMADETTTETIPIGFNSVKLINMDGTSSTPILINNNGINEVTIDVGERPLYLEEKPNFAQLDNYDLKYWFKPGDEEWLPYSSNPEYPSIGIRNWIEDLSPSYWKSVQIDSVSANTEPSFGISTDKTTYSIGEPITFHLNLTNTDSVSKTILYNITLESKDSSIKSPNREIHQILNGNILLDPSASRVYDVTSTVPVLPFDRIIYAVAKIEENQAVTTFEIKPSFEHSVDYSLIEREAGKINLSLKNNGSTAINALNAKLTTFSNIEVLVPEQSVGSIAPGETVILSWNVNVLSSGFSMLTFNISSSDSGSGKITLLAQITAKPKLLVEADPMRINPGNPVTVTADITNLGDIGLNNVIAELRLEDGITTSNPLTQTIGLLEGRTTKQVSWTLTGSNFGNYLYSVYAKDGDVNASDIETITIIEEGHGVDLKVDNLDGKSKKNTFIKTPVDYAIDVINTGTKEDIIDVYVFPRGINWTTILSDAGTQTTTSPHRVTVPAGATHRLNLQLTPYPQVSNGEEFNVDIQAVSEKDTSKVDRGIAQAIVVSETQPILTVNPTTVSKTINHDSFETIKLTVKNEGLSILNNVELTTTGTITPWIILSQNNITSIDPGASVDIDVTISVPRYQAPNIYEGEIEFTSENGGTTVVRISVDVPIAYEVVSNVNPTFNSAVPGNIASYQVTLKNEGNMVDRYAPVVENSTKAGDGNISRSWVSSSKINITLNPGISDTVTLDIMPPHRWSTKPGIYNFVVNVSSPSTFDTNQATLKVLNFSEVDVKITGSLAVNPPEPPIDPDVQRIIKQNPSGRIKVIIKTNSKPGSNEKAQIEKEGGKVKYSYHLINGMAADVPAKSVEKIASKTFVKKIELDKKVIAVLDISVSAINASTAYSSGLNGKGIDVAVLDTGIDHNHPAFTSIGLEYDFVDGDNYSEDLNGHGTHVAGIIASNDTTYRGVAPGVTLMPVRVLDKNGAGNSSDVIAGMEWAVDHGAEILSLSLGGEGGNGSSALSQAADSAVAKGVVVVAAAGNGGPSYGTIASPGDARNVITVGAVNDAGVIAGFSSRGPTTDGRIKPDIVAPGVRISSTKLNGGFVSKDGTSMSTPHVSGATALLLQAYNSDPQEIKEAITKTAKNLGYDNNTQGAGMIDVDASYFYLKNLNKPIIQNVKPGGSATYDIELTNMGNINDVFSLTLVPEDFGSQYYSYPTNIQSTWVTLNSNSAASPGEQIFDNANVLIPVKWAGMVDTIYTFKIQAISGKDSTASDNVIGKLVINPTKRSKIEYIGLEVKWLSDYINSLSIDYSIKNSLLNKTTNATKKNDQALNFLLNRDEMQSNNMLGAEYNIINAFISEVDAQKGKGLSVNDAGILRLKAELITQHINDAILTPIG